jgi:apolipoprotein N-acyltransferase
MAVFRAVENGMSIYRQTGSVVSSVIDAYGRILQRVDAFKEDSTGSFAAVRIVPTPIHSVNTLYPAIGDLVGNIMLVLSAGLLVRLLWNPKRQPSDLEIGSVSV